jgi:ethanolamine-phosphate cytidylyltransferase
MEEGHVVREAAVIRPVRVWMDMCADLYHYGHANALRQAKALGDALIVGVHPNSEIIHHKGGPPVMNQHERIVMIAACKWVDEVTGDAPYVTTLATLAKYNIDFTVHGEDITTDAEGVDSYQEVKDAGKFRLITRTQGVSSTDLIERMLLRLECGGFAPPPTVSLMDLERKETASFDIMSLLQEFKAGNRDPDLERDKIVYIDGDFDLLHPGHISVLRQARGLGTYLIVGIFNDIDIKRIYGESFPIIMTLYERVLTVLSCKYVDNIIIGANVNITNEFLDAHHISVVVHSNFYGNSTCDKKQSEQEKPTIDRYRFAKSRGIYKQVTSTYPGLTSLSILNRVVSNSDTYRHRDALHPVAV